MKKILFIIFASLLVLSGCSKGETKTEKPAEKQTASQSQEAKQEQKMTIKISQDKNAKTIATKTVAFADGANLMDVMKKNFKIDTQYKGAFISGIDGLKADDAKKTAWMFSVNGKPATKGAKDIVLKNGDVVDFDLQKY